MWRLVLLLFPTLAFGQGSFNVELLDHWSDDNLMANSTNVRYNDCWGYTQDGIEYALAGSTEGTHVFQISDDGKFTFIDSVAGQFQSTMVIHRDIKTYQHYAYAVCDEGESSLQIIDLSYLPDSVHVVTNDHSFKRVHNLFIDEENALMYACLITAPVGIVSPMIVFSLADPENPVAVYSGLTGIPEVHDAYVRDNIAFLNCGVDGIRVYDFTDVANPIFLHNLNFYQDQGYNHQGWLSPDGTKYVFGDETSGAQLKLCSVDAASEVTIEKKFGTNWEDGSVAHNIVITNEFAYVAYYNEGLRIYDLRTPFPTEIAYYDTYPIEEPLFKMQGAWGIYASYPSGRLLVSDRHTGLYLMDFNEELFTVSTGNDVDVFPNPIVDGQPLTIKFNIEDFEDLEIKVYNYLGQIVDQTSIENQSYTEMTLDLATGMYIVRIKYVDYLGEQVFLQKKILIK